MAHLVVRAFLFAAPIAAFVVAGNAACSSSSDAAASPADASVDAAALSSDEQDAFTTAGGSLTANQQMASLADSLFDFDPTIDPSATAAMNAAAIGQNAQKNLGSCGKVTVSGASVTVAFGAPPGCTLVTGITVSGTVVLSVSKSGATTTVAATLTSVVVDGTSLSGTAQFATSNGTTFAVTTDLALGTKTDVANLTVEGQTGQFTLSGTSSVTEGPTTSSLTFTNVTVAYGECYATGGSLTIGEGPVTETLTFSASTPSTGVVSLQIGKRMTTTTLPAYGDCPSGAKDGG